MLKRILARLYQPLTDLRDQERRHYEQLASLLISIRESQVSTTERLINLRSQLMSSIEEVRREIQNMIQQARTNHDVEMSATQAIHSLLDRLDEQVSQGDLEAIRQTVASMRESAGSLGQAIAATEGGGKQPSGETGSQEPAGPAAGEPVSPVAPEEDSNQPS